MISHWICDSIVDAFSSKTDTLSLNVEAHKIRLYLYSPRLICLQCSKQQDGRVKVVLGQEKNFGSGQLIFENWSGGPVDFFLFFLNHNINIPNLIVQKVLKLEIQIKPVLI